MSSKLEDMKKEHPQWCFRCGFSFSINCAKGACSTSPVIAALVAALEAMEKENDSIRAHLTAEQTAHAETKRALESNGVRAIAAERLRQIQSEGWTPGHDDEHPNGELALAAACYAQPEEYRTLRESLFTLDFPVDWPWHPSWWKPGERRRELEKAGALIAAEIDRLDRLARQAQRREGE